MTYTFNCEKCGEFDITMSHNEIKEIIKCPNCGNDSRREYKPMNWTVPGGYNDTNKTT